MVPFILGIQAKIVSRLITAKTANAVRVINASTGPVDTRVLVTLHILENTARSESTFALAKPVKMVDHVSMVCKMLRVTVSILSLEVNVSLITVSFIHVDYLRGKSLICNLPKTQEVGISLYIGGTGTCGILKGAFMRIFRNHRHLFLAFSEVGSPVLQRNCQVIEITGNIWQIHVTNCN